MRSLLLVTAFFFTQLVSAQDITGIWRGSFSSASFNGFNPLNTEERYKLEVQVEQLGKSLNGVTYSYKTTVFYGKSTANGTVNAQTGKIRLEELKIVELKMQEMGLACIMTYYLQYSKNGDEEFLEGKFSSYGEKDSSDCGKGTVFLRKVATSDFHKEPFLVKREIRKQQKELADLAASKKKAVPPVAAGTAKSRPAAQPATKPKPVTPAPAPPAIAKKPPVNTARPPVTGKTATPPAGAIAGNPVKKAPVTPRLTPPENRGTTVSPRPMDNKNIPDLARTDTLSAKKVPEIKRGIVVVPKVLASRENELVKTIVVNSNDVILKIYDNGTIDHDTISVYLDKKLVISKQMLTTMPITVKLNMDNDNPVHELVMVAENLGDFPPNTSLMVVQAGDKQYEVRITSTEQKNAVVIFKYERPGE